MLRVVRRLVVMTWMAGLATRQLAFAAEAESPAGQDLVVVENGPFVYGDSAGEPDERPAQKVSLSAFAIERTEVTVAAYRRCVQAHGCAARPELDAQDGALPMTQVSFDEAAAYCRFVGRRLPTEKEWEKAARGSDGRRYPWGNEFSCAHGNFGNYAGDGRCAEAGAAGKPVQVGRFPQGASPWGALDMAGNVWEWVDGRAEDAPATEDSLRGRRVVRGGGCCSILGLPRSSDRLALPGSYRDVDIGFRCAAGLPTDKKSILAPSLPKVSR